LEQVEGAFEDANNFDILLMSVKVTPLTLVMASQTPFLGATQPTTQNSYNIIDENTSVIF